MGIIGLIARSAFWMVVVVAVASIAIAAMGAGADVLGIDSEPASLDEEQVEDEIQAQINDIRVNSTMIVLKHERALYQQSEAHTERMAENDELAHQIGESRAEERLGKAGCGYGSENVAQSWQFEDIDIPDGPTISTNSEEDLAAAIVASWMSSDGHRDNILNNEWRDTAVSVEITEQGKVYATQMFCE